MKKILLSIAFLTLTITSCKENKKGEVKTKAPVTVKEQTKDVVANSIDQSVNISTSLIEWVGSKPTESHNGTINFTHGKLVISKDHLVGGDFEVDMNTIKNLDEEKDEMKVKLEGHLKGADFFDVKKYPTTKFVIASIKENGDKIDVTGNLTIKDKTASVTFPATFKKTEEGYSLQSDEFKINRLDFNVTYKSKTLDAALKDKFINDLIGFKVLVNTKK